MKVEPPNIRVFASSESKGNPYEPDAVACLNTGLYCETVMKTRQPLLVPDALADDDWKSNPDIKLGMISYLGFPISWPDGEIFGTICVLDNQKNEYGDLYRKLLLHYREVLQADLKSLATVHAQLATQKAHLEELFARVPEAIVMVDAGRVVRANPEFTKIFGYAESEVLGRSLNDLIVPEELRAEARQITLGGNRRGSLSFETVRTRKDGTRVPVSVMRVPVTSAEGRQISEYVIYRDITESKRAEEEQRYYTQLLKTVSDNASPMLYIVDRAALTTFVNPSVEQITGYRDEELIGHVAHEKIHHTKPDGTPYPVSECPLRQAVRTGKSARGEDIFVRKDGSFFPVRYTASPIFRDGVAVGTFIEVVDLTEVKAAEQGLRNQAELLNLAHDAIIVRDPESRITFWNPGAETAYGWSAAEAMGKVTHDLLQT